MTTAEVRQFKNLLIYVCIAIANMVAIALAAGVASGNLAGFRPGDPFEVAGPAMAALLAVVTPVLSTWLASNRPRIGSEEIAAQVDQRRRHGQSRKTMVVRTAGSPPATVDDTVSAEQAARIADILESRMRATPASGGSHSGSVHNDDSLYNQRKRPELPPVPQLPINDGARMAQEGKP
jgi:hypothetical protein